MERPRLNDRPCERAAADLRYNRRPPAPVDKRPRHAAPIYAGIVRQQKTYRRATQSQFMTFRTISNNPATMRYDTQTQIKGYNVMGNTASVNWMHPGIEARGLFEKADIYVQRIAGAILLGSK